MKISDTVAAWYVDKYSDELMSTADQGNEL